MNILIVTAYPPVLHMHGGGVRMYHNIRLLAQRHHVHVLSFVGNDDDVEMLRPVGDICDSIRPVLRIPDFRPHWLSVKPFLVREFSAPEMHQAVDEMLRAKKIDVIQCEYLQMAQFRRRGVFTVLTAHEILSKNAHEAFVNEADPVEKLRLFYRWMQMLNYEIAQIRKFDRVVTMTQEDAAYARSYAPSADIRAVPIGVDPEEFTPVMDPEQALSALFVGNFRHTPNVEALRFIVRHIAPRFPNIRFLIPGSHVPEDINAGPNVSFPGYCADTRQLYRSPNTIVLAPLFSGTGQRVKLLEAFSMACPVITTTVGAMGYPIRNGDQAIVADTVEEFVAGMQRLIASRELRERMGENGRKMMLERFTWERIGNELEGVVQKAVTLTNSVGEIGGEIGDVDQFFAKNWSTSPISPISPTELVNVTAFPPLLKRLLFPIKAVTFIWRFLILLICFAYLEGSRVTRG